MTLSDYEYYRTDLGVLYHGDCLEIMPRLEPVDMILCDLPYGTTACTWDTVIPFEPLWIEYNRIVNKDSAVVLFGKEPFSSYLRISNIKNYKYDWVWDKKIPSGMCNAKIMPMQQVELISVFINGKNFYNAIMKKRDRPIKSGGNKESISGGTKGFSGEYNKIYNVKFPTTLLRFNKIRHGSFHPTQKPVALFEYLIKTYTNDKNLIMDNCIGSGTTAIACERLKRKWIGIEIEEKYCEIAAKRIELERKQLKLF